MSDLRATKPSIGGLRRGRRKAVTVSQQELMRKTDLLPDNRLPLLVEPTVDGINLTAWVGRQLDFVNQTLHERGGILFRGFDVVAEGGLEKFVEALSGDLLEYTYRSTPRTRLSGKIYTSTEYPADQSIPQHNEMSYSRQWPLKIAFCCIQPSTTGGETPITDSRAVYQGLDPALRDRFIAKGVMYVRNYGKGLDLPWQDVFQTDDRGQVESFCRDHHIELEWQSDDQLTTRQVCQAVAEHPKTGEPVWFNQAHLFHVSSLKPEVRESLVQALGEGGLPRHALYGDGTPIEESALEEIRGVYDELSVVFPWRRGDLMLLDNMLVAHGRRPFEGQRKVVVGMAEAFTLAS